MNKNIKYFLGIDGGGTKTEFLFTDLNENEINRIVLGASNPVSTGIKNTLAVLNEGIRKICEGFDFGEISVFAGVAGSKTGENQKIICDFLSDFNFASYDCKSSLY